MMRNLFLLAASAAVLAACAAPAPQYPTRADPLGTAPRPPVAMQPIPNPPADPAPRAVPAAPVGATTLPPIGTQPSGSTATSQPPASAAQASGLRYTVAPGDTLYGIARRFGAEPRALASLNGLTFESTIRSGQRLQLPAPVRDGGVQAGAAGAAPTGTGQAAPPSRPAVTPPAGTAPVLPPPSAGPTDVAAVGRGKFLWPIRGEILSRFGPQGTGQRNDGLNIAAGEGTPVKAAAGGEVAYAGDQVPGFGNLVLIRHPDGFVTAYAHLSDIAVKAKQTVSQGQQLGAVGSTGGVGRSQLHFEIRYAPTTRDKARPVDPELLLPR